MSIRQQPHFRLQSKELAEWLDRQGNTSWWSIDGDPCLTERLNFPCPSDELADELRRINKWLLLLAPEERRDADGRDVKAEELDTLAQVDEFQDRAFQLCWDDCRPEIDWVLAEDVE